MEELNKLLEEANKKIQTQFYEHEQQQQKQKVQKLPASHPHHDLYNQVGDSGGSHVTSHKDHAQKAHPSRLPPLANNAEEAPSHKSDHIHGHGHHHQKEDMPYVAPYHPPTNASSNSYISNSNAVFANALRLYGGLHFPPKHFQQPQFLQPPVQPIHHQQHHASAGHESSETAPSSSSAHAHNHHSGHSGHPTHPPSHTHAPTLASNPISVPAKSTETTNTPQNGTIPVVNKPPLQSQMSMKNHKPISLHNSLDDVGKVIEMFSFRSNVWEKVEIIDFSSNVTQHRCKFPDGSMMWLDVAKKPTRAPLAY